MAEILIVDDDFSLREVLEIALLRRSHRVFTARGLKSAWEILQRESPDLAVVDLRLGNESGIDLLRRIKENWRDMPVLMITAYADPKSAVEVMKLGADDYITKPFDLDEFLEIAERTVQAGRLARENARLRGMISDKYQAFIGNSPKMQEIFSLIGRVAPTSINVLITGESGTGKELAARAVHAGSSRADKPFMAINCGGLPDNLVESELFGYKKGAFTGADKSKKGLIEIAEGGTLFLDEVAELHPQIQVKLLRYIQERKFIPLGGTEEITSDVRIIAATNRGIQELTAGGSFREDLFYRLSGVIISLPPLRERGEEDIYELAEYFLRRACLEQKRRIAGFSSQAMSKLSKYHYPGNVRELENIIERAAALETGNEISPESLVIYEKSVQKDDSSAAQRIFEGKMSIDEYIAAEERSILAEALERTHGHKGRAAELVGLNFRQFRYRLGKAGLDDDNQT